MKGVNKNSISTHRERNESSQVKLSAKLLKYATENGYSVPPLALDDITLIICVIWKILKKILIRHFNFPKIAW